jgi:hypothetical protein
MRRDPLVLAERTTADKTAKFEATKAAVKSKLAARGGAPETFHAAGAAAPGAVDPASIARQDLRELAAFLEEL